MRAWGRVTNPTARASASWLCALWGRHEGAQGGGGAFAWVFLIGHSATPDRPSFGACGRGPLPTGCWCGGCRRGDPSPTPQRALLRAGFALSGGGTRAPRRGASCLAVRRPGSGALPPSTARRLRRAAGAHYPLAVGAGGAGVGTRHQPHSTRSRELALRAVGAARGCPGGAPLAWASWIGRSSTPDRPSFWACGRGPLPTGSGCGRCGCGDPSPTPQRALLCELALRPVGAAPGRPGGGRLLPGCGASGVRRSPTLDRPSIGACGRGPLPTGCGCGGCGRRDPSPSPQHALLRAGFARCGGGTRVPGGAPLAWASWIGRSSSPDHLSFQGVRPGPTTHWLWVRGVRA